MQQLPQLFLRRKGQPGGADLGAEILGVEGLVRSHAEKIKLGLLPVAEEQIFADGHTKHGADGGAFFHGVSRLAGDPVIVDAQLLQQVECGGLLGE